MTTEIQKLHNVWANFRNKDEQNTDLPQVTFDDLNNSIISTGPFYFYIIDFADMSLSHISPSIYDIHNFKYSYIKEVSFEIKAEVLEAFKECMAKYSDNAK